MPGGRGLEWDRGHLPPWVAALTLWTLLGPDPWAQLTPSALPTEPYSYDFPEDVAPALGTSFSHLLATTNPIQQKKSECLRWAWQGRGGSRGGASMGAGQELPVGSLELS